MLLKDKVVVVEEDVVLMDGEDTVDEEDVILPEVVGELLKDEEVVLLEDVVLGRDVLVRETRVREVEVVPLDDDEVVLEGDVVLPEAEEVELLVVVLLTSEDVVPEDDVVPEELENEVGSPKLADVVLESEVLLLGDVEVLDKDGTVLAEVAERLGEVESEGLRVAVVLTLDDVEVEISVVDDALSEDTELIEDAVERPENEVELVEDDVVLLEDELVDPTAEEEEDTPGGLQTSLTIPAASR